MCRYRGSLFLRLSLAGLALLLAFPFLARADGGPILSDPELWAMIDEGQQIAVVHLQQDSTARVDLFISMADRSGQSHQVTFFLPLGVEARDFGVAEERSLAFDEALTEPIEARLKAARSEEADYRDLVQASLLLGALATHGAWSWPAGLPVWLRHFHLPGLIGGGAPVATFETPSSQVAIYDMNAETDLQALIETTGLDPKVKETLASLQGQQIAVVTLQTQPVPVEEEPGYQGGPEGQPGIHLGWRSTLVSQSAETTYTYPLGTGKAWASPIELTRVYVASPPELDFRVEYPELGEDLSGPEETGYGELAWRIDHARGPAFAVDEAYGDFGHIWRVTYVKSNSAQDLVVTRLEGVSREVQRAIRHAQVRGLVSRITWPIALLAGTAAWLTAWRIVIPRRLGVPYRWREWKLWRDGLKWAGLYAAMSLVVVPAGSLATVYAVGPCTPLAFVIGLPVMLVALGLANAFFYARSQAETLQATRGRAFGAYLLVVLMANALYLTFAAGYGAIVGAF